MFNVSIELPLGIIDKGRASPRSPVCLEFGSSEQRVRPVRRKGKNEMGVRWGFAAKRTQQAQMQAKACHIWKSACAAEIVFVVLLI